MMTVNFVQHHLHCLGQDLVMVNIYGRYYYSKQILLKCSLIFFFSNFRQIRNVLSVDSDISACYDPLPHVLLCYMLG